MLVRLKELRETAGISQKFLAEHIGVSQQSINKYENHNIEPDISTLSLIADFFGVSVDYLIGHSSIPHKIEPVKSFDLNTDEESLISKYRKLNSSQKQSIHLVVDNYISK